MNSRKKFSKKIKSKYFEIPVPVQYILWLKMGSRSVYVYILIYMIYTHTTVGRPWMERSPLVSYPLISSSASSYSKCNLVDCIECGLAEFYLRKGVAVASGAVDIVESNSHYCTRSDRSIVASHVQLRPMPSLNLKNWTSVARSTELHVVDLTPAPPCGRLPPFQWFHICRTRRRTVL